MKNEQNENTAAEMADFCLEQLEKTGSEPAQVLDTRIEGGELIERLKIFAREKLLWFTAPEGRAHRLALGMFITVCFALLGDGGGITPDGQWKTGGAR